MVVPDVPPTTSASSLDDSAHSSCSMARSLAASASSQLALASAQRAASVRCCSRSSPSSSSCDASTWDDAVRTACAAQKTRRGVAATGACG